MSNGKDLAAQFEEILRRLEAEEESKVDRVVGKEDFHISPDGGVEVSGLGRVRFTETGFRQFSQRMRMPAEYAWRCYTQAPDLWAAQVRRWWPEAEDKPILVRAKERDGGKVIRALLSPKYRAIDYLPVAGTVAGIARETGAEATNWNVTEDFLDLRLTFPGLRRTIGKLSDGKTDDWAMPGIHVRNSETGLSALRVELVIHRIVCTNGMIVRRSEYQVERRHFGRRDDVEGLVASAANRMEDAFEAYIERARKAKEDRVDAQKAVEALAGRHGWTVEQRDAVLAAWGEEPGETAHHVAQAITAAARNFDWTRRLQMQRAAAEYLGV